MRQRRGMSLVGVGTGKSTPFRSRVSPRGASRNPEGPLPLVPEDVACSLFLVVWTDFSPSGEKNRAFWSLGVIHCFHNITEDEIYADVVAKSIVIKRKR